MSTLESSSRARHSYFATWHFDPHNLTRPDTSQRPWLYFPPRCPIVMHQRQPAGIGPLCNKQFARSRSAINSLCAMCRYRHNRRPGVGPSPHSTPAPETNEVFQVYCWDLSCVCLRRCAHVCLCAWTLWRWVIITSLPAFGEITAVVSAANKVPGGAQYHAAIAHDITFLKLFFPSLVILCLHLTPSLSF